MGNHLRHRVGLRLALAVFVFVLAGMQWSVDPGMNAFVGMWSMAAIAGVLASTLAPWSRGPEGRSSLLPLGVQAGLVGAVLGAFVVIVASASAPVTAGGMLLALGGLYDDLFRAAWRQRPGWATPGPAGVPRTGEGG